MIQIKGKGGIQVKVIADSVSEKGDRLTTLHCTYHRFIHSEVMTHRVFSRNARSSRAVPVLKMIEEIKQNPAFPIHVGKNKKGMQAGESLTEKELRFFCESWLEASKDAIFHAGYFEELGVHKQITNRVLEPFLFIDTLITATEWDNFFNLRLHKDAQPEIQELARCIKEAMDTSKPGEMESGDWHLPYVSFEEIEEMFYRKEDLRKISAARCARISYKPFDESQINTDKDLELSKRLLESKHLSPFEHQATPINRVIEYDQGLWYQSNLNQPGVTHIDRNNSLWSNNFRGWVQYRALVSK